jgi:FkbM family methyltransferase
MAAKCKADMMAKLRAQRRCVLKKVTKIHGQRRELKKTEYFRRRRLVERGSPSVLVEKPTWITEQSGKTFTRYKCGPYQISLQLNTADESCLKELFERRIYDSSFKKGQTWLDLGAHKALFSIRAVMAGACHVYSYEPYRPNYVVAKENGGGWPITFYNLAAVQADRCSIDLYVSKGRYDTWRHCIKATKGRVKVHVRAMSMRRILQQHPSVTAVKLDIEGEDLAILEGTTWPRRIRTLVFEYSFSHDPDVRRFKRIINKLKSRFAVVDFPPSALRRPQRADGTYIRYGNRDVIVQCKDW